MQPWPLEALDERAGDLAAGFAELVTRPAAWRHRCVETITLRSHELARRHVSIDLTVPADLREQLRISAQEWVVPLTWLTKRPLAHFDLRDEGDDALPLLRSDESRLISRELLYLTLEIDVEDADPAVVSPLIERILSAEPEDADAIVAEVDALQRRLSLQLPEFAGLAATLTHSFLLCAVVGDVERRRVLKFAYDEPLARSGRWTHVYTVPGCVQAASFHVEVAMPDELRAYTTDLVDIRTGTRLAPGPRNADRPAVHYVATGAEPVLAPRLIVHYGAERGRFLVPAALLAWVIAFALALPWLLADLSALTNSSAVTILLSTSAIFSGLVLRGGEHPLVRLSLARYRLTLVAATVAAVVAGGMLTFEASDALLRWSWGLAALVSVVVAGILSVEVARAPASRTSR